MGTLKGQNLRICVLGRNPATYKVIAMATNCSINLTNNVESRTTKDDVGMSDKPVTTSKSWTVSVDSLDVTDTAAMLTAIKSMTPMKLYWNETLTTDNQAWGTTYPRSGMAFMSDVTFQFDNRTLSTKSIQFSGTGAIDFESHDDLDVELVPAGSYTHGQFVRLFLSSDNTTEPAAVIAAAKTLSLHIGVSLEDATTKDTAGDWQVQEPTAITYDITTSALYKSGETITSSVAGKSYNDLQTIYNNGTPVKWKIANIGAGANNRTASSTIVSGSAVLTRLELTAPNRSNTEYTTQLNGYGDYDVAA